MANPTASNTATTTTANPELPTKPTPNNRKSPKSSYFARTPSDQSTNPRHQCIPATGAPQPTNQLTIQPGNEDAAGNPPSSSQHPCHPQTKRNLNQKKRKSHPKNRTIKILSVNARGLKGKLTSLKIALNDSGADIAAISETHAKHHQKVPGYIYAGNTRPDKGGGGVAFLIKKTLAKYVSLLPLNDNQDHEAIWIRLDTSPPLYIASYYGKQESDPVETAQQDLALLSDRTKSYISQGAKVLLLGDFNAKIGHPTGGPITRNGQFLLDIIHQNNLTVINQTNKCQGVWTRVQKSSNPGTPPQQSVIDFAIVSQDLFDSVQSMIIDEEGHLKLQTRKLSQSDHNTITISLKLSKLPTIPHTAKTYKWKINDNTNWEAFQNSLETQSQHLNNANSYEAWADIILKTAHSTIGSQQVKPSSKTLPNTPNVRSAKATKKEAKQKLSKAYKDEPSTLPEAKRIHEEAKCALEHEVYEAEAHRITQTLQKINSSGGVHSKTFWNLKKSTDQW